MARLRSQEPGRRQTGRQKSFPERAQGAWEGGQAALSREYGRENGAAATKPAASGQSGDRRALVPGRKLIVALSLGVPCLGLGIQHPVQAQIMLDTLQPCFGVAQAKQ